MILAIIDVFKSSHVLCFESWRTEVNEYFFKRLKMIIRFACFSEDVAIVNKTKAVCTQIQETLAESALRYKRYLADFSQSCLGPLFSCSQRFKLFGFPIFWPWLVNWTLCSLFPLPFSDTNYLPLLCVGECLLLRVKINLVLFLIGSK